MKKFTPVNVVKGIKNNIRDVKKQRERRKLVHLGPVTADEKIQKFMRDVKERKLSGMYA